MFLLRVLLCQVVLSAFVFGAESSPSPAATTKTDSSATIKAEPANLAAAPQAASQPAAKKEEMAIKLMLPKQANVPSKIPLELDSINEKTVSTVSDFISLLPNGVKSGEITITVFVNTTGIEIPKEINYDPKTGKLIGNKKNTRTYGKYILKCSIANDKWSIKYTKPGPYFSIESTEPLTPACAKK